MINTYNCSVDPKLLVHRWKAVKQVAKDVKGKKYLGQDSYGLAESDFGVE